MQVYECATAGDVPIVARSVLNEFPDSRKFAFFGEMGSGKTTIIKAMCRELGLTANVDSPTYTLMNIYDGPPVVVHFDFYRISSVEEVFDLGYEEYFYDDNYVFIEWSELIEPLLHKSFIRVYLSRDGSTSEKRWVKIV